MSTEKNFDVIIMGAGSVGTPAAMALAGAGLKVLVIERMPSVGQGSNKRAIGGLRATFSDPAKIRICLRSIEIVSNWKEAHGDDIEWTKSGYSFVAYRDEEAKSLKELLTVQKKYGLNIDWLEAKDLLKVIPDLNPDGLIGGTFSPEDGSASSLLTCHAMYVEARKRGAVFHFNEEIKGIIQKGGRAAGVRTDKAEYGAEVVINAAGAWAADVASLSGLKVLVTPDCHEAAVTEAVAEFCPVMVVDIRPAPGSVNYYFYQHATGQFIFCITPDPHIWGKDMRETSRFLPMVSKRMIEIMPRLKNLRVRRTWRGLYPMTPDGFPIVGWINELKGYLLAVGMCGQGFMLGPGVGELLARIIQDKLTADDRETLTYLDPYREFKGLEKLQ